MGTKVDTSSEQNKPDRKSLLRIIPPQVYIYFFFGGGGVHFLKQGKQYKINFSTSDDLF